ncbi:hybrid sensor histidine kinase/response regulator [Pontibacter sp. SGAir0037]|uniref:hybrid sensor histidine kinase/response regulator n=1 Tax=Pontibacter sp. SGAir0037 TaxID=2571030 RepID=UPI0010CD4CD3|nr:hybrid sensor histidine kinase/response regulator [Pontibacter sp. SGAir0037]QCR21487.1 hybrid sensor histidine kinase/response regulator [Pontibacter sp. SGAir0037]
MPDKIRVLLIDDDEDDFIITRDIIDDIPGRYYHLEWANSYQKGLELIGEHRHHVYLVDFRLGAQDGLELITQAVERGTEAPFILLTGQSDRETDERAMRVGALDYLVKGTLTPFDLERSIRYSIEHAKSLAEIQKLNSELEQRVEERTQELAEAIRKLELTNKSLYEAEQEVRKALQKEKELHELKSRFVTIASHEFRTPLSTVLSSASLISKYKTAEDDEKRNKHVNRIKSAVSNLTSILNDFLSISRIEEGKIYNVPSSFDLEVFSQEVTEDMQGLLKQGQQIKYKHQGKEKSVYLDKQLLKNIMFNLLSNASKYSGEGKAIRFTTQMAGGTISIEVEDQGIGIPDADKTHLFTPFFRAQNVTNIQGTGLGLNIVKRYVDIMGGTMSYKSILDKGTTFTVTFPLNKTVL